MIVIVCLAGGLGNQLFQYAAGRALAEVCGAQLLLDTSAYQYERLGRQYRLDRFCIRAELVSPEDVDRLTWRERRDLFSRAWRRVVEPMLPRIWRRVFVDQELGYDSAFLRIRRSVVLQGYWQNEKYFADIAPMIRREYQLRDDPDYRNAHMLNLIGSTASVSLHVRRGDYVSNPHTNAVHGVCEVEYYCDAMKFISERIGASHYFVFSDDPEWARANLCFNGPVTFVQHNGAERDYEDLRLMSACRHHIMANSSFSWWGAWLAERPGQVVVAPKVWFQDPRRCARDLIPERWERI